MNITIIGAGHLGLTIANCIASKNHHVTLFDIDAKKISSLKNKSLTIFEPNLEKLFLKNTKNNQLSFTSVFDQNASSSNLFILALPSENNAKGEVDISQIELTIKMFLKLKLRNKIIINKSTVPVGTTEKLNKLFPKDLNNIVVSNPEFLKEGSAVNDFLKPDRVIVGTTSAKAKTIIRKFYTSLKIPKNKIIFMSEKAAEFSKYAANSYLASRISFINELANLSKKIGVNYKDIKKTLSTDKRIGPHFLNPGLGFNGSCLPKDTLAFLNFSKQKKSKLTILDSAIKANKEQKELLLNQLKTHFKNNLKNKRIIIFGLTFKLNTSDTRNSPAIYMIKELLELKAKITVHDPIALQFFKPHFKTKIDYNSNPYEAAKNGDALLILTPWPYYKKLDYEKIRRQMNTFTIFNPFF